MINKEKEIRNNTISLKSKFADKFNTAISQSVQFSRTRTRYFNPAGYTTEWLRDGRMRETRNEIAYKVTEFMALFRK